MTKESYSMLRKYIFEACLLALAGAVLTLFNLYLSLNNYVRETLTNQVVQSNEVVKENTRALNEVNILLTSKHLQHEKN